MDQLKGYLVACTSFDVEWIEQEEEENTSAVIAVEQFRKEKSIGQVQNIYFKCIIHLCCFLGFSRSTSLSS